MSDEMLTPAQVAEELSVSLQFVYDLCDADQEKGVQPELGHHRIGRKILIPRPELDALLKRSFRAPVVRLDDHRLRQHAAA
jgi:excisionase family DNA binding protein